MSGSSQEEAKGPGRDTCTYANLWPLLYVPAVRGPHSPEITRVARGWAVVCVECQKDSRMSGSSLPIGIGMRLESMETAQQICENHAKPRIAAAN